MKCRKVSRLSTLDLSLQASRRCGGKSDICISPFEFIARQEGVVEDWRWRGLDDNMSDNMGDNDGGLKLFWDYLDSRWEKGWKGGVRKSSGSRCKVQRIRL